MIIIAIGLCVVLGVLAADWLNRHLNRYDPEAVIRRCRLSLWCVRRDLDSLPATWAVYDVYSQAEREEKRMNRMEAEALRESQ